MDNMKTKFTILAFGLLLAVGWTSSAHAQRLPGAKPLSTTFDFSAPSRLVTNNHQAVGTATPLLPMSLIPKPGMTSTITPTTRERHRNQPISQIRRPSPIR